MPGYWLPWPGKTKTGPAPVGRAVPRITDGSSCPVASAVRALWSWSGAVVTVRTARWGKVVVRVVVRAWEMVRAESSGCSVTWVSRRRA